MENTYKRLSRQHWLVMMIWMISLALSSTVLAQTGGALALTLPTYNCSTGAITFNTSGGDGSPITYTAPGVARSSVFSNTGIVEEGLRKDPKPITITATQRAHTSSVTFDLPNYCLIAGLKLPVLVSPIDNLTITVGDKLDQLIASQHFRDPNVYHGIGYTLTSFRATNTPPGLNFIDATAGASTSAYFTGIPTVPGVYFVTVTCYFYAGITNDLSTSTTFTITVVDKPVVNPPTGSSLALTQPTYNCSTGAIHFNTSGGDGTPIEFMAPGITSWTTNPNHVLDACARTCSDIPPFLISARQSGKLATYTWSRQDYCANVPSIVRVSPINDMTVAVGQSVYFTIGLAFSSSPTISWSVGAQGLPPGISYFFRQEGGGSPNPTWVLIGTPTTAGVYSVTAFASANGGSASTTFNYIVTNATTPLTLTAPTYNCSTGGITFNTSGGDGTPIEFKSIGITDWTTNPNQFVDKESRTASDVQPFTLMARQSSQVVMLTWDLKAACGRARLGVEGTNGHLSVTVLGNPVHDQLRVLLEGIQGQVLQLRLTDAGGRLLENRTIKSAGVREEQSFRLDQSSPGLLLLQATTNTQLQTVKVIKQ